MKKTLFFIALSFIVSTSAFAQDIYQRSYTKKDGTSVEGSYRTRSNDTNTDNYSTKLNTNPYSGQSGTKAPDYSPGASNYGSGRQIQTGSRGGQYYTNDNGNKVYVPKRSSGF